MFIVSNVFEEQKFWLTEDILPEPTPRKAKIKQQQQ